MIPSGVKLVAQEVEFHVIKNWRCPECKSENFPTGKHPLKKMVTCTTCQKKFTVKYI